MQVTAREPDNAFAWRELAQARSERGEEALAQLASAEQSFALGDYGLAKFISCSRRSGHTESAGTVHYMAPEVANGGYGKKIDI